jgi:Uma2 family endonuclease
MSVDVLTRRWTRDEYYRMADSGILRPDDRVELIDGGIVTMAPRKSPHATAIRLVEDALRTVFSDGFEVRPQLPLALDETNEPEPDLAVVTGSPRDYADDHPTTALLVVEVAETSLGFDRGVKKALYARFGIQEYWIVNLVETVVEVHRSPQGESYREHRVLTETDSIAALAKPETRIAVADLLP